MGYRSEVKIATTREGYDQMCERVDTLSEGLGTSPLMGSCRKPDFFEESDGCVVFGWDYIKWYEGLLADVSNVADALSEIDELWYPFEFCRIGESWDDIEFRASCNNDELALKWVLVNVGISAVILLVVNMLKRKNLLTAASRGRKCAA